MFYQRVIIVFVLLFFLGKTSSATEWCENESEIYDKNKTVYLVYDTSSQGWKKFVEFDLKNSMNPAKIREFLETGEKAVFQTLLLEVEKKPQKKEGVTSLLFEIIHSKCKGAFYAADSLGVINIRSGNIREAFKWYDLAETLIPKDEVIDSDYLFNYAMILTCHKEDFEHGSEKALSKAWNL